MQALRQTLSKLAGETVAVEYGWRRIAEGQATGLLGSVIGEIGETVLPRRITLRRDGETELCLAVGNRRILRFLEPVPAPLSADGALFGTALAEQDEDMPARVLSMLRVFCAQDRSLRVRSDWISPVEAQAGTGISAANLARAHMNAEPHDTIDDTGPAVAAFQSQVQRHCGAWVRLKAGSVDATSGGGEIGAGMTDWVLQTLSGISLKDQDSANFCTLRAADGAAALDVVVSYRDTCLIARDVTLAVAELGARWRSAGL